MELKECVGIKQFEEWQIVQEEDDQLVEDCLPSDKISVVIHTGRYLIEIEID
jgi:hypothetical protein